MDYREYKTNVWFWIQTALISSGIGGLTGYLFFDAWWGSLLIPVCMPVVYSRLRRWHLERQTRQLKMEFQEVMTLISGCMHAGYSLENAIVQVRRTSGEEFSLMREELQILVNGIACHKRVEQLLLALAERCDVEEIRELAIHYAKKGDLLYPLLKVKYGISGPSDVMWTTDDEIRDELSGLAKAKGQDEAWKQRMERALTRAEEMIYKEANILFPNCAVHFTEEEWTGIYQDAKDYAVCLSVEPKSWERAEKILQERTACQRESDDGEIVMAGGHLAVEELEAMLNTIPMEITFVDVENKNRFFNEGHKVFKRPAMALGREVISCHPPKVEQQVRRIIEEFRAGTLDEVPVWMNKNGRIMLVKYMAVRNRNGQYIGTLELVQDMEFAREYFERKHD